MPLLVFSLPVKSRNTSDVYYSYSCKWDCHAINVVTYWLITGKLNQQADQFGLKKCLPFSWYLHGDSTSPQVGDPPNNRCVMIMGCCLVKTFSPYDWWGHLWVGLVESPWKMAGAAWKAILTFQMPIPNRFFHLEPVFQLQSGVVSSVALVTMGSRHLALTQMPSGFGKASHMKRFGIPVATWNHSYKTAAGCLLRVINWSIVKDSNISMLSWG